MTCRVPVGEIRHTPEGEYPCNVNLWGYGSKGSLWSHHNAVSNITPGSPDSNISTTILTPKGRAVMINVSSSGPLVGVDDGLLNSWFVTPRFINIEGVCNSY